MSANQNKNTGRVPIEELLKLNLPAGEDLEHPACDEGLSREEAMRLMANHSLELLKYLPADFQDHPSRRPSTERFRWID